MTLRRILVYVLAALAAAGWLSAWWSARRADRIAEADIAPILTAAGFIQARGKPQIPDLPPAARPVAVVAGRIVYGHRPGPDGAVPRGNVTSEQDLTSLGHGQGPKDVTGETDVTWRPAPEDLAGSCRAEIAAGPAGKPWGRLFWSGSVRLQDGSEVARGPELVPGAEFAWTASPAPRRTLVGLDLGLVGRPEGVGYELGGRLCPARWALPERLAEARLCAYGRVERVGAGVGAGAGVSVLFGPGGR